MATSSSPLRSKSQSIPCRADGRLDRVQGVAAHPQQDRHFGGEPFVAVGQAVGEAGRAEPTVATGRTVGDPLRLQQHDVAAGLLLGRLHRGPEPGEPTTDHDQISVDGLDQPAAGDRTLRSVQPVRLGRGVREHLARTRHARNILGRP